MLDKLTELIHNDSMTEFTVGAKVHHKVFELIKYTIRSEKKNIYKGMDLSLPYADFCNLANERWINYLLGIFSKEIVGGLHVGLFNTETYTHYYSKLHDEMRHDVLKTLRNNCSLETLESFIGKPHKLYDFVIDKFGERFVEIHNKEFWGENVIFLELRDALSRAILMKSNRQRNF